MSDLSIVVVGPNELLRRQVCDAVTLRDAQVAREYAIYPDVSQRHALSNLTEQDVLRHCAARLEDFMVPKLVEICGSLPKSANGKIDKKALAMIPA